MNAIQRRRKRRKLLEERNLGIRFHREARQMGLRGREAMMYVFKRLFMPGAKKMFNATSTILLRLPPSTVPVSGKAVTSNALFPQRMKTAGPE